MPGFVMTGQGSQAFPVTKRFSLRRQLGAGGMGIVYEAYDEERQEVVALKTMIRADPAMLYRFKHEFRAFADMVHPNLVRLYELISAEEQWFFTMELVPGTDFVKHTRGASPSWPRLRAGFLQLVEGVRALHEAGYLHRDIKPSNVLVRPDGRVVVLDFGLIADLHRGNARESTSMQIAGTPAYMAPEQATYRPLTESADWYAVGVLLYEALTGHLPFAQPGLPADRNANQSSPTEAADELETLSRAQRQHDWLRMLEAKQRAEPSPPSALVADVPEDLDRVCVQLLRRLPHARPDGDHIVRLLETTPNAPPARSPVASASPVGGTAAPFVGRRSELEALSEALADVRRGQSVAVFVHGLSGMGKTALLRRFLDDLPDRDQIVLLEGRCYEQESVPYKALDSVVDMLSHYLASLPPVQQAELMPRDIAPLAQVFPVLGQVRAVAQAPRRLLESPDPHTLRRKAFAALRELLARIGDRRALIVYIDDLQWGDSDSAAVLGDILRPPDPPTLLLLTAHRTEDAARAVLVERLLGSLSKARTDGRVRMLALEPLSTEETRELAAALLAPRDEEVADRLLDQIVRESGNHPYFLNELAQHARAASVDPRSPAPTAGISLDQVLRDRIGGLSEDARQLLETVAVAGRPIPRAVAFEASGLTSTAHGALDLLKDEHLIRTSGGPPIHLESYHDRIREECLGRIPDVRRRAHHQGLAETLVTRQEADPEHLAVHFAGAGHHENAAYYAKEAADRAAAALAFERAALLYQRSRELVEHNEDQARFLTARQADALANAGRGAEAAASYLEAAASAPPGEALEFRRLATEHLLASGHMDEGLEVARQVLGMVHMRLPRTPQTALAALLVKRVHLRLRGLGYRERDLSEIPPRLLTMIDTCWSLALGLAVVDNIRGADFQARHLLLALRAGEPYRVARALAMESGFQAVRGGESHRRTAELSAAALDLARKTGHPHALGLATMAQGIGAYLVGQWRRSAELCEQAIEVLQERCVGVTWELASAQRFMIAAWLFLGRLEEMHRRLPSLVEEATRRGNLYATANLRTRMQHVICLAADDPEASRRELDDAMRLWTPHGFHLQHYSALFGHAQTDLYVGAGAAALERVTGNWGRLKKSLLMRVQVLHIEVLHLRARCGLAACRGRREDDRLLHLVKRDAQRIVRQRMAWANPLADLLRAGVAARQGDPGTARRLLSAAAAGFDRAEMSLLAEATRRQLGKLIGGTEGHELVQAAESWMAGQLIEDPSRMSAMLVPGIVDGSG
jgi:serine/threonine protein kinase/tetratricopeptide (TPR) repeat protein